MMICPETFLAGVRCELEAGHEKEGPHRQGETFWKDAPDEQEPN